MAQAARQAADERAEAQAHMQNQLAKQRAEEHFWITFNRLGDTDKVDTVYIGAAGVSYNIRKGERVPLPQSAINVLKDAVRIGVDHGHPVIRNGRKYFRRVRESEYSYSIEGSCSAAEAAAWRAEQARLNKPHGDYIPADNDDGDMIDAGEA